MPEGVLPALMFAWRQVELEVFRRQSRSLFYPSLSPGLFCKASPSLCDQNLMCHSVTRPKKYAVAEIFTQTKNFAMNIDHFPNRNTWNTDTAHIFFWGLSLRCQCKLLPRLKWSQPLRFLFLPTFIQLWWGRTILPALTLIQRWLYLRGRGLLWPAWQGVTILPLLFHADLIFVIFSPQVTHLGWPFWSPTTEECQFVSPCAPVHNVHFVKYDGPVVKS